MGRICSLISQKIIKIRLYHTFSTITASINKKNLLFSQIIMVSFELKIEIERRKNENILLEIKSNP